jgi:hypothetical protein
MYVEKGGRSRAVRSVVVRKIVGKTSEPLAYILDDCTPHTLR